MTSPWTGSSDRDLFAATTANRLLIADFLDELSADDWQADSLCAGWDVHTTAAHLLQPMLVGFGRFFVTSLRYRGDTDRVVDHLARRLSRHPPSEVIRLLRRHAADEVSPPRVGPMGPFAETCIHLQDIAIPLGRDVDVPSEHWDVLLRYLVSADAAPALTPGGRLDRMRIEATDSDWSHGSGPALRGSEPRPRDGALRSPRNTGPALRTRSADARGAQAPPNGFSPAFLPLKAKSSRSVISKVSSSRPWRGRKSGSRRSEKPLPSIARWKVSATIRAPTPRSLPLPVSDSRSR